MVQEQGEQLQKPQQQQQQCYNQSISPTPFMMASSKLPLGQQAQWMWKVAAKERSFQQKRGSGGSNSSDGSSGRGLNWWASGEGSMRGSKRGSRKEGEDADDTGGSGQVRDMSRLRMSRFKAGFGGGSGSGDGIGSGSGNSSGGGGNGSDSTSVALSALPGILRTSQVVGSAGDARVSGVNQDQVVGNAGLQGTAVKALNSAGNMVEKKSRCLWLGFGLWRRKELQEEGGDERGPELQFLEGNMQNCKPHGPRFTE